MSCRSLTGSAKQSFSRTLRSATWVACFALNGCLGGQSGGETGSLDEEPDAPAACACIAAGSNTVRAKLIRHEQGCAELVVTELLHEPLPGEYMPLAVGDTFGGATVPFCAGDAEVREGDEVFAQFTRGTQDSVGCPEYLACSTERCGDPNSLVTMTMASECEERRSKDSSVDCAPALENDEPAIAEYDRCDTQCLEETREVCARHANDTQLGGNVIVAPWHEGQVSFFWAGELRQETVEDLAAADCQARHHELWVSYYEQSGHLQPTDGEDDVAAAPSNPKPEAVCPLSPRQ